MNPWSFTYFNVRHCVRAKDHDDAQRIANELVGQSYESRLGSSYPHLLGPIENAHTAQYPEIIIEFINGDEIARKRIREKLARAGL